MQQGVESRGYVAAMAEVGLLPRLPTTSILGKKIRHDKSSRRMHSQRLGAQMEYFFLVETHSDDSSSSSHADLCEEARGGSSGRGSSQRLGLVVVLDAVHDVIGWWVLLLNVAGSCVRTEEEDVMGWRLELWRERTRATMNNDLSTNG